MKKRVLAALMAMLMVVGMAGCGNTPAASSSEPSRSSEAAPPSSETESLVESEVKESEVEESTKEEESGELSENEEMGGNEEGREDAGNKGYLYYSIWSYSVSRYEMWTVYRLNMDDYSCEPVSSFTFTYNSPHYERADQQLYYYSPYFLLAESRFIYSKDFSKCATNYLLDSGEKHAGWLNSDGTFTDVTEVVGEASKSEFEVAKHFVSMGFTDDGRFIYYNEDNDTFHYVYVDKLDKSYADDDSLIPEFKQLKYDNYTYRFSDWWTDDEHYLGYIDLGRGNDFEFGAIININDATDYELFFAEDLPRHNWNMLLSPDEKSVIFLSGYQEYYRQDEQELYVMDLETREPILIPHDINKRPIRLLDWRED